MDNKDQPQSSDEDMRELLRQMQRTTTLLAERLAYSQGTLARDILPGTSSQGHHARDILPGTSSSSLIPPFHSSLPTLTSTPSCFRTNSTRWQPYPSTSGFLSSQESSREDGIQVNLSRLFRPYNSNPGQGGSKGKYLKKKREVPWSHYFFCLSEPESNFVPSLEDTQVLEECGLGRKLLTFSSNTGSHSELTECLYQAYPLLGDAGGYVLARSDRRRELTNIPMPPSGYSVPYVRHYCKGKRTPIYIIPLQKQIELQPKEYVPAVMQECFTCKSHIMLSHLAEHLEKCKCKDANTNSEESKDSVSQSENSSSDDEAVLLAIELSLQDCVTTEQSTADGLNEAGTDPSCVAPQNEVLLPVVISSDEEDTHDNRISGEHQLNEMCPSQPTTANMPDLETALRRLEDQLDPGLPPVSNYINVMRDTVLPSAMRAFARQRFAPQRRLNVIFVDAENTGEGAVDVPQENFLDYSWWS
ncbi:uncharacterized protein LOC130434141 [Triplophysa dalaica]|uniref:uncharacterized protein LOC130434141 n=1 Tax=Triplophysa dalaica TaxID=1582913 RepID=UPI0024E01F67|nr:uncharacterized protein LOC130434141 [Triplophysa dalaica]XP_056620084.1 uncharacterized protein LOC130434141 [Triplophysa dalaica]